MARLSGWFATHGRTSISNGSGIIGEFEREFADAQGLLSMMILVLLIGITIDAVGFGTIERAIRRRRGLTAT